MIPLSSQSAAQEAINQANESLKKSGQYGAPSSDSDTLDDDETQQAGQHVHDEQVSLGSLDLSTKIDLSAARSSNSARSTSSVAEDVIEKKGQYGRFAERWFSKKGWTTEKRRVQGMSIDGVEKLGTSSGQMAGLEDSQSTPLFPATMLNGAESSDRTPNLGVPNQAPGMSGGPPSNITNTLLPKLLRTTRMLLGSRSFFFSYELDITRRLGTNDEKGSVIPLHKSVDPLVSY